MAALSDQLLVVTILAYLVAMVGYAAQYAFGRRGPVARATSGPARQPALHATHASTTPGSGTDDGGGTDGGGGGTDGGGGGTDGGTTAGARSVLIGQFPLTALLLAAVAHLSTFVTRGLAAERLPWGNMYEFILTASLIGVLTWLVTVFRQPSVGHLGLYVSLVAVVLLGLAGMSPLYTPVGPLVPALDSYWLLIHVAAAATGAGIFLVGFITAVMYLVRTGYDRGRRGFPFPLGIRVPAAGVVERLTFRLHAFGFPVWTFAVVAGAIWAESSWGRYWAWDPKEVWAFISWVVYAAYLHARATPSVKPTTAAWLAIAGWITILMNLFGVNLFLESLHSYA
jgi:cytochrome c-type biogenesis protein CcsB